MSGRRREWIWRGLGLLLILPVLARAAGPLPAGAQGEVRIGGQVVDYTANWSELALEGERGEPRATISGTTYLRSGAVAREQRPVMFFFNGGPGASSSPLHFSGFGPVLFTGPRDEAGYRKREYNSASPLDVADLVFIDPVGTGFSRDLSGEEHSPYWSVDGDARAVTRFIRDWLKRHRRESSPVYIVGESYGGFRLATMAPMLEDLNIAGLILVSPMLDASGSSESPGNDLPHVHAFPSMAVAAWHHGRGGVEADSAETLWREAADFARRHYLPALVPGALLSSEEKRRLAGDMARFLGLPEAAIVEADLRVGTQAFLETLLADKRLLVGRLDSRVTAPVKPPENPDRPAAANDPALGLGKSNVIVSQDITRYLTRDLGVDTTRQYNSLTLDVNFAWNWQDAGAPGGPRFYINPAPKLAGLMEKRPAMQVLVLGGYYDLATPILAARWAITHAGLPMERVSFRYFDAGHSPFDGAEQRARVSAEVKDFLEATRQ